jgi:uncharacterized RDD family membrane protein YckC
MGCGVILALYLPLWFLIAATVIQLYPDLRGQWMVDPLKQSVEFVEYGFFSQWLRGGLIATGLLGVASPIVGVVVLIATGASFVSQQRGQVAALAYAGAAGPAALDVPLVVRKRKRGATEVAIPIRVVLASARRRLLAKLTDLVLLYGAGLGGALVGILATVGTFDWGAIAWTWPLAGAGAVMAALVVVQWAAVVERGQTLGKMLFDIRVVEAARDRPPTVRAGLLFRHVVPEVFGLGLSTGLSLFTAWGTVRLLTEFSLDALFLVDVLRVLVALGAFPVWFTAYELLRGIGVLFGRMQTPHDRLAATRVVRTAVGESDDSDAAPMGFRLVARAVDSLLLMLVMGLPMGAAALAQAAGMPEQPALIAGLGLASLAGLAVQIWQWVSLSQHGTTLGRRLVHIRVVDSNGDPPGFVRGVIAREWVGVSALGAMLPGLWGFGDFVLGLGDDGRTAHDQLTGTRVVWDA